ncbi:MAG: FAD-dependent oxidoreductase [Candidatus Marinimicrobia bacterium]|jgi:glutamate synthase (NADPH/NADH) small chain|nr:FAD-dependent oxidoreductase [Candidatus Neomarinimicrobiota bacterium]MBT3634225.1 FAD-dependent oxidoreductase [Candidatus Neomarinimicrobiota bacterium]MBT3682976.1 FAD-dependent oxidoreductase [Candidatus Neomarinimicrobiota bacterium]MBT3760034.1 FAD-dependent oxidoreductase [Candidatus Neomarinimicrobiota bacterium]MBT3896199.1 FAD-dependent oxidoreductase [Candidatus Neomarinimicrobiota bacterium]
MTPELQQQFQLSKTRLESDFPESKPLFSESEALIEANRCLFCYDAPCTKACPADIDISSFIKKIKTGNIRGAATTIFSSNMMGISTSQVCPVEELCAGACVFLEYNQSPINIGRLQRYAVEKALQMEKSSGRKLFPSHKNRSQKVALIGAGPASLACASYLALEGIHPIIFEKNNLPGGLNLTGIAPYKFKSEAALSEINWLLDHGIELKTGVEIGRDIHIKSLIEEYDAVFIGSGLGRDKFLNIPGKSGTNVWGATALIKKIKNEVDFNLSRSFNSAVIIGGGNTAIDIARELAMLNIAEVNILYRRTEDVMRGYAHEISGARKHGVRLIENITPSEIMLENGKVSGLRAEHSVTGESINYNCDMVIFAIGQEKQASHFSEYLKYDDSGCILVDDKTCQTDHPKIYAGGDSINGGKEVVNAAADGRKAAFAMLKSWDIQPNLDSKKKGSYHG